MYYINSESMIYITATLATGNVYSYNILWAMLFETYLLCNET